MFLSLPSPLSKNKYIKSLKKKKGGLLKELVRRELRLGP